ncbi:hypothetical protein MTP99_001446 [Tenebrio molitor]|jgi:von Hippel-Lindau disease tumor supressor|uniref:RING-CH-type domain-containing protein n=1 Tax=Tenebrio molitor TaxID=7067 RepID=A0A8J6HGS5_TENMO|nr:hypothetical protein GEV33_008436 [Tenebrio molitor]KAJ3638037.1 hypothetical protein MTP99_001446 [Tenebrio molitor]CAH1365154.1 unnamed protein product [Tenebrio molitor]
MFRHLLQMAGLGSSCTRDCSGRGECNNGTCMCDIRYTGELCDGPNVPYHAGIGGVFFLVGLVCAIQLIMCVISEYQRLKAPTFLKACRITTQKAIYFVMCIASLIRGAYFISPDSFEYGWSSSLLSSYYPLLMSSSSLIVCFWAEVFHLQGIRWDKSQFLSKSLLGFVTFNIISYSLLLAEVITTTLAEPPPNDPGFYSHLFNGCYAVLLFINVIFFLIYGVEVFFKVRGGFVGKPLQLAGSSAESEPLQAEDLRPQINISQLHQSRIGLLSQALMLIIIVGFLFSETLSEFWKTKVPIVSRNWHDVVFRVVEIGVAVWFPAVLWNCMQPSELWILNPQKLLAKLDQKTPEYVASTSSAPADDEAFLDKRECWICYDADKPEPLIQPCACTGDVSSVHHDCLRRWLMESSSGSGDALKCKVCNYEYEVCSTTKLDWERGFTSKHWGCNAVVVTCLCVVVAVAWIVIQLYDNSYIRMLSASVALLVIYICIKFLGQTTLSAYQRAKVAALNIGNHVTTISGAVNIETNDSQPQAAL